MMTVGVLAVAVGVNLLVFTIVNALWVRPLPFADPARLVTIPQASVTGLDQPQFQIFEGGVAGQVITADRYLGLTPQLEIPEAGRSLEILGVTPSYFRLFGLSIRGRDFSDDDDRAGAEPVAIISDRLWERAFDRRPDIFGQVLASRPLPVRVIGVAPPTFEGARRGERADIWIPSALVRRLAPAGAEWPTPLLMVFARLGNEQTAAEVEQRYRDFMKPQDRAWFEANDPSGLPRVVQLKDVFGTPATQTFMVGERGAVMVVSGLALLVLLGGCATTAALVMVHYERRRAEFALRTALGASRRRLVLELSKDLLLIASAGSIAGILVAVIGVQLLPSVSLPGGVDLGRLQLVIDWRVCLVAIVATLVTLSVASALPIARSTVSRLAGELVGGMAGSTFASQRFRQALLALQVAATIVVLVAAGLFVRAVLHAFGGGPGFDVARTVFVSIQEGSPHGRLDLDTRTIIAERAARLGGVLKSLDGIDSVAEGISPVGPDARVAKPSTIRLDGHEFLLPVGRLNGSHNLLTTLGVPILAGRSLRLEDATGTPVPVVLTAGLASHLVTNGTALGKTLSIPALRGGPYLVVGIAGNLAFGSISDPASGVIVTATGGTSAVVSRFVIKTNRPDVVAEQIRQTVRGQIVTVATGREILAQDMGRQRLGAWFFSGFGLAALILGIGGVSGLVSYYAESQRREFGLRLALGASLGQLVWHGTTAALIPVSIGLVVGLVLAGAVAQLFSALLAGIGTVDLLTYALVGATMFGCSTFAAVAAAWRLRRTSPSDGLRAT